MDKIYLSKYTIHIFQAERTPERDIAKCRHSHKPTNPYSDNYVQPFHGWEILCDYHIACVAHTPWVAPTANIVLSFQDKKRSSRQQQKIYPQSLRASPLLGGTFDPAHITIYYLTTTKVLHNREVPRNEAEGKAFTLLEIGLLQKINPASGMHSATTVPVT